jgi:2-polyprenyl-3-methyl-5-hydroxy-6-metoxy-1,4-benzoquinol methylase
MGNGIDKTERIRRFWDRRPCNARHSQVDVSVDPLLYSQQVTARKYLVEPHLVEFSEFDRWAGKRVLDLGCGIGTQSISFALAGADVVAIDLSSASLEIAAKRLKAHGLQDRVRLLCGNVELLRDILPIRRYDLVYAWGSIHHCLHPERVLAEIEPYMGPHSIFRAMVYHRWSAKGLQILFRHGGWMRPASAVRRYSEAQSGSPITWLYSRGEAYALFAEYAIDDLRVDHIFPYRIPEYIKGLYVREWYWRILPDRVFRRLERTVGWHLMITARRRQ